MLLSSKHDESDGNKSFEVYSSYITWASLVLTVCHKVFQYIIGDGILLSWTGPCGTQYIPVKK